MLTDNHGRPVNYLRLAVTDRCNLRCFYCMPAHGLEWLERKELMSWEEMLQVCSVLVGVDDEDEDMLGNEYVLERGQRCPEECPPPSALNS